MGIPEKQVFLVTYDYGMGGLWDTVLARSAEEILVAYPEVAVVTDKPQGISNEYYEQLWSRKAPIDIDDVPAGLFVAVLAARRRHS